MRSQKIKTLTVSLVPTIKSVPRQTSNREHCSLASMFEVMIREWCSRESASMVGPLSASS